MSHSVSLEGTVGLYFDLKHEQQIDLEAAALAAIEWARGLKAAAIAVDPDFDYRVRFVAAEPGSSKWLAKIERSKINQAAKDIASGWEQLPLVLRLSLALVVVIPTTAVPTWEYWLGDQEFSESQIQQLEELFEKAQSNPEVQERRQSIYREVQKDRNIIGLGGGLPDDKAWRPKNLIPSSQFAEADGLFQLQEVIREDERTIYQVLDVILVTPRLVNAPRSWVFRQEGLPGTFNAEMKDVSFLKALDENRINETLRANIHMTIKLEVKQSLIGGEWRTKRRGRSVIEVIRPKPDLSE